MSDSREHTPKQNVKWRLVSVTVDLHSFTCQFLFMRLWVDPVRAAALIPAATCSVLGPPAWLIAQLTIQETLVINMNLIIRDKTSRNHVMNMKITAGYVLPGIMYGINVS